MTDRLLTVEDIALRWQCAKQTVREAIHRGELKETRLGRLVRVAKAEVERYERERTAA